MDWVKDCGAACVTWPLPLAALRLCWEVDERLFYMLLGSRVQNAPSLPHSPC